jgi:hypothetical protein
MLPGGSSLEATSLGEANAYVVVGLYAVVKVRRLRAPRPSYGA